MIKKTILEAIGNTPVVRLNKVVPKNCADVFVNSNTTTPPDLTKTEWRWP
jgi:hypothetical protein